METQRNFIDNKVDTLAQINDQIILDSLEVTDTMSTQ